MIAIYKIYYNTSDLASPHEQTSCRFRGNKTPRSSNSYPVAPKQWAVLFGKEQWLYIMDEM